MDEQVLAAMARWPNVPAAHGWLSLSRRGLWLLHPHGGAWGAPDVEPGEPITNPRITDFIGRNYQSDAQGHWYFQNGPQRVYVRLDGAPWILSTAPDTRNPLSLTTHTGQPYGPVTHWWLDDDGNLYTQAAQGAGLIRDRDLAQAAEALCTVDGQPLGDWLDTPDHAADAALCVRPAGQPAAHGDSRDSLAATAPFGRLRSGTEETILGFVRRPPAPPPAR